MQKSYYGAEPNKDLDPGLLRRDIRPLRYRIKDFISQYSGWALVILGLLVGMIPFSEMPQVSDLLFVFGILFYFYSKNKVRGYLFRRPITPEMSKKEANNAGIMLIGNQKDNGAGIWFSNDDLRTHMLLFGSTGCGKSRTLLSLMYQALIFGSGLMYVDGKADNSIAWLMYSIARRLGREDDFLVVNYLTGQTDSSGKDFSLTRLSNTTNPFAYGDGESLRSLLVGLMRGGDNGGDMWKGRASAMIGALLKALVYMRDRGDIVLDVSKIREYLPLDKVCELTTEHNIPEGFIEPLKKYLLELPGYSEDDAMMGTIQAKAWEQHGYIIMQFSEVMSNLSDTYGHIFSSPMGETDFVDVVFNRRILFVMLPSIGVDPDSLAGLGKLIIASVRSALSPALGNKLEGSKVEVIDTKPTNSSVPFILCLDEYGYYAVRGFAVVAAQARSLGVSVIFAGQDYPSFKKSDEIEAQATVANTNIKIVMKLEDAEETYKVVRARAGEETQMVADRYEAGGALGNYQDGLSTRAEKVSKLAIEDLVDQDAGEGFIIWRNVVRPMQMFFADPIEVEDAELNKFLMVRPPESRVIKSLEGGEKRLRQIFGLEKTADEIISLSTDRGIVDFLKDFKALKLAGDSSNESALSAIGLMAYKDQQKDKQFKRKAGLDEVENVKNGLRVKNISSYKQEKAREEIGETTINNDDYGEFQVGDVEKTVINRHMHQDMENDALESEMENLINQSATPKNWESGDGLEEIDDLSTDALDRPTEGTFSDIGNELSEDDDFITQGSSGALEAVSVVDGKGEKMVMNFDALERDADLSENAGKTTLDYMDILRSAVNSMQGDSDEYTIAEQNGMTIMGQTEEINAISPDGSKNALSDLKRVMARVSNYAENEPSKINKELIKEKTKSLKELVKNKK